MILNGNIFEVDFNTHHLTAHVPSSSDFAEWCARGYLLIISPKQLEPMHINKAGK